MTRQHNSGYGFSWHLLSQQTFQWIIVDFRKPASGTAAKKSMPGGGSGGAGMWKFYTEDSPGIKVWVLTNRTPHVVVMITSPNTPNNQAWWQYYKNLSSGSGSHSYCQLNCSSAVLCVKYVFGWYTSLCKTVVFAAVLFEGHESEKAWFWAGIHTQTEFVRISTLDTNYRFTYCRGPVPVLVMSLLFIASVFVLHIWGKYSRS